VRRLTLLVVLGAGCPKNATPTNYEFPAGFHGQYVVEFSVAGKPALPVSSGRQVEVFDATGQLATSTPQTFGTVDARFERGGKPLVLTSCSGATCKLADGEAAILGTGAETAGGVTRKIEFGAIGPCEVGYSAPGLPPR
jgi:hypothetical protein